MFPFRCPRFCLNPHMAQAKPIQSPHSVSIDPRPGKIHRVLIADRGNHRLQEFDRDGRFPGS